MIKFFRVVLASLVIGLFSVNASAAAMQHDCSGLVCWTKKLFVAGADIIRAPFDWVRGRWNHWDGDKSTWGKSRREMRHMRRR